MVMTTCRYLHCCIHSVDMALLDFFSRLLHEQEKRDLRFFHLCCKNKQGHKNTVFTSKVITMNMDRFEKITCNNWIRTFWRKPNVNSKLFALIEQEKEQEGI